MARGSAGNVIAALVSAFIPGLGQLIQGRLAQAVVMFLLAALFHYLYQQGVLASMGLPLVVRDALRWAGHAIAAYEAAVWRGGRR